LTFFFLTLVFWLNCKLVPTGAAALSKKIQLQDRLVAINDVEVRVAEAFLYLLRYHMLGI
jgi:hypothetical protein